MIRKPGHDTTSPADPDPRVAYWQDPDRVEKFAGREPDQRLARLVSEGALPAGMRVLDLGCAGGRNTRFLIEHRFDTTAVDISPAMIARTRQAIASVCPPDEAQRRARVGRMDDLGFLADGSIGLLVALGIYHQACDEKELDRVLSESARVLGPGGRALVAVFGPGTRLNGRSFTPIPGTLYVHRDDEMGTLCLLTGGELDGEMARHGLQPGTATETVIVDRDDSHRVVANGLFVKS